MKVQKIINHIKQLFSKKSLNYFLSFAFVLFLPTQLGKHFFFNFSYVNGVKIDYLSPTLYLTDIIFIILFVLNYKYFSSLFIKKNRNVWIVCGFLIINIIFAKYQFLSLYQALKIIELVFIFVFFTKLRDWQFVIKSFFLISCVELILAIFQFINKSSIQNIFYFLGERSFFLSTPGIAKIYFFGHEFLRTYATFSHPNSMGGFYLLTYFFFLTSNIFEDKKLRINLLVISSILLFLSFSKTVITTYVLLNLFYIIKNTNKTRLFWIVRMIPIVIVGGFLMGMKTDPLSLEKRLAVYQNSISIITNNLLLGVGLNHYLIYQANYPIKYSYFFLQPVHNIVLLLASETGIVFTIYLIYLLFKKNKERFFNNVCFLICFLVVLFTGTIDHYWMTLQQNWLLLGVIFGILNNKSVRIMQGELKP